MLTPHAVVDVFFLAGPTSGEEEEDNGIMYNHTGLSMH